MSLTVAATSVPVASGSTYEPTPHGDVARAFSGRMRSDVRAFHRVVRVTTVEMETADKDTLLGVLQTASPVSCSGDLIGTAADFHVQAIRVRPITATDFVISFELHETAATP